MGGFYIATDKVFVGHDRSLSWYDESTHQNPSTPFNHLYWIAEKRTWNSIVELADVFPTVEAAEAEATMAVALDGAVLGHVHIVPHEEVQAREKANINARFAANVKAYAFGKSSGAEVYEPTGPSDTEDPADCTDDPAGDV